MQRPGVKRTVCLLTEATSDAHATNRRMFVAYSLITNRLGVVLIFQIFTLESKLTGEFFPTFYSISLVKFERKTLEVKEKLTK